jgi:ketosteroid isomerase-like protein
MACDERVIAFREALRGTAASEGGGTYELLIGVVALVEHGRITRWDQYDTDDRQTMIARYAELGGGLGPLGDRPPERVLRAILYAIARRDLDTMYNDLVTDDFIQVDHRKLGWSETNANGHRGILESMWASALDVRLDVDEVLACDDRVIATLQPMRGHSADGGGEFEISTGMVIEFVDGRMRRLDRYEYDDRVAMLDRYAELTGGLRSVLGDRPPERVAGRLCRRWTAADIETLIGLFTDDVVRVDHRSLGYEEAHGRDGLRETYLAMLGVSSEVLIDAEEVLAFDDRVLLFRATLRGVAIEGGGEIATPCGYLLVVADHRIERLEQFEPDDRQAMLAQFAALGGGQTPLLGDRPPERYLREFCRRFATGDLDKIVELFTEDYRRIDDRMLSWEETGKADHRALFESFCTEWCDLWAQVVEVLACDDRVSALTWIMHGRHRAGGGTFEIFMGAVVVVTEGGRNTHDDIYDPDERQAMIARFAELGGGLGPLGDRAPEQFQREWCRRLATGEPERMAELYRKDFRRVDHRAIGWEATGQTDQRAFYESFFTAGCDLWARIVEVLACDDRVIALTWIAHGRHRDGGGTFEIPIGDVMVIENGLMRSADVYGPDDRDAVLARFAELAGAQENAPLDRHQS